MKDLIVLGVPFLAFATYYLLLILVLRSRGLRPIYGLGAVTPEKAAAWTRFRRWQFVAIHGFLVFTVPMFLAICGNHYLSWKFDPHYVAHPHYYWDALALIILVVGGLLIGLDLWRRIWNHTYDLGPVPTH